MILHSVRLRNWRGIRDATFTPLESGVTGITGVNGAGKSTMQDGLLWALYGRMPDNAKKEDIRRTGSGHRDECSVSVVFTHAGQKIEVLRQLTGKNHTTTVYVYVDGREQTHTSTGVANTWIATRLGMDVNTFLTAHVVKQKHLDALLETGAAERRTLIEKFFGIEKTAEALTAARNDANESRKAAQGLPGGPDEVQTATEALKEAEEREAAEHSNYEYLESTLITAETVMTQAETVAREIQQQQQDHQERVEMLRQVQTQHDSLTQQQQHAQVLVDQYRETASQVVDNPTEAVQAAEQEVARRSAVLAEQQNLARSVADQQAAVDALQTRLDALQADRKALMERIATFGDPTADVVRLQDEAQAVDVRMGQLHATIDTATTLRDQQQKSLDLLVTPHHDGTHPSCPTCAHPLEDPAALQTQISTQIQEHLHTVAVAGQEMSALAQRKTTLGADLSRVQSRVVESARLDQQKKELQRQMDAVAEELTQAQSLLDERSAVLVDAPEESVCRENLQSAEQSLRSLMGAVQRQEEIRTAGRKQVAQEKVLAEITRQLEELQPVLDRERYALDITTCPSDLEVQVVMGDQEDARRQVMEKREGLATARGELRAATTWVQTCRKSLGDAQSRLAAKTAALVGAEEKTAVVEVLDAFRRDRLARIVPELAEVATGLIATATHGYYTEVRLDENFTPSLVRASDGGMVLDSRMSGGERSVVSLALRIAIGDIMSGGNPGLLWLDEVLVSQDADRRTALMSAIRDLNRQVIMVNHTTGEHDILDKTIKVVKNDTEGSYLEES